MSVLVSPQLRGRKNIINEDNGRILGELCAFTDTANLPGVNRETVKSGMLSYARIVKNSGSALAPGVNASFVANQYGTHVSGSPADDALCDGVVDPDLTSNVATGDTFLLFVEGPCKVIVSAAVAGPCVVPSGSGKFKTALSSVATRSGRTLEAGGSLSDGDTMRVFLQCNRLH